MLKLVLPTEEYKEQVLSYRDEFLQNGDSLDGTNGLNNAESFESWCGRVRDMRDGRNLPEKLVSSTTLLGINEEGRLVGMIDIRHRLNDALLRQGGHIGYSVRKSERRKGYAAEMLDLALKEAKKLGISRALVTCSKENIGSAKTILKNGGGLENEIGDGEKTVQRYWIEV